MIDRGSASKLAQHGQQLVVGNAQVDHGTKTLQRNLLLVSKTSRFTWLLESPSSLPAASLSQLSPGDSAHGPLHRMSS